MKALLLKDYNIFICQEVTRPEIEYDKVLVKVKAYGICGSDVHGMDGSTGRRIPPIIMEKTEHLLVFKPTVVQCLLPE